MSNVCCLASFHYLSSQYLIPQAAQAHYVWVRASEVIWSEYTIPSSTEHYKFYSVQYSMERKSTKRRLNWP